MKKVKTQQKQTMDKQPQQKKSLNNYTRFSGIAIQMLIIIGVGTFIGVKMDEIFPNNSKQFSLIFSLASVILSIFVTIRRIITVSKDDK